MRVAISLDRWTDLPDVCANCGGVARRRIEVLSARDDDGVIDVDAQAKRSVGVFLLGGWIALLFDAFTSKDKVIAVELPICPDCIRKTTFTAQFTDFAAGTIGVLVHPSLRDALAAKNRRRSQA